MEGNVSVKVNHVYKSYKNPERGGINIEVLHDICFEVKEGEKVGIIGRNGAGKSTLLNILCQYAKEDKGSICIEGKVNSILDIGSNLQQELTGKENVRQTGKLYGYDHDRLEKILLEVEEFVDIGDYWTRPIKTYSSGMKARIAFAQIAFIQPEILIIDEVLGVGDYQFVEKSKNKIQELCSKGKILFMVSHSLDSIKRITNRCIWIEKGKIILDGITENVVKAYEEFVNDFERKKIWENERNYIEKELINDRNKMTYIKSLCISNGRTKENTFISGEDLYLEIDIKLNDLCGKHNLKLRIEDYKGNIYLENNYLEDSGNYLEENGKMELKMSTVIKNMNYTESIYTLSLILSNNENIVDCKERVFRIIDYKKEYYSFPLGYTTSIWDIIFKGEHIKNEHIWSNSRSI